MLKTNSKVYYVYEFGGQYEDSWEHPIGVCSTLTLAQELKKETEAKRNEPCNIPEEEYVEMENALYEYEDEHGEIYDEIVEGLAKLFPQYSPEDLQTAKKKYSFYDDYVGVEIEEINFYN